MKSTWRSQDRTQWTLSHWIFEWANVHHVDVDRELPIHRKHEKVPYFPDWQLHCCIIVHASIPLVIHQLYVSTRDANSDPLSPTSATTPRCSSRPVRYAPCASKAISKTS
ncbi:hypothetical protein EYZ11_003579 [Aspergillus tanneri]|uniref:Uncharacterized protein n=1 Tax=Aspergillus tanneri TaxID=1220188 RepID=A0A4S3JQ17_9EURO|nr:hypothetical protein EYZ11_003579 [Aspergillus tanneri]